MNTAIPTGANSSTTTNTTTANHNHQNNNPNNIQVLKSSPWTSDDKRQYCTSCHKPFDNFFNRRHHCRLCGDIFCNSCSDQRALIPPSSIVLQPKGGKKVSSFERSSGQYGGGGGGGGRVDGYYGNNNTNGNSFQSDEDPDRIVTFAKTIVESNDNHHGSSSGSRLDASNSSGMENNSGDYKFAESARSLSSDGMSLTTIQIQQNLADLKENENYDDDMTNNTNDDENAISQSMAALMPPSFSHPMSLEEEEEGEEAENVDDDLSVSVATSTAFSYVSNNVTNQKQQKQQQQQQQRIAQSQQQEELQQQQEEQDEDERQPLSPKQYGLRQVSSSSDTSTIGGYMPQTSTILYGKGLEERMKLAREPLRVCIPCHDQLQSIQEELRIHNSNAMKYNSIDPTNIRRLLNSPLAFTLGHEIRKAAYTLNNLLPMPRRMGLFLDAGGGTIGGGNEFGCDTKETCKGFVGNFGNIDGVKIPAKLLARAKGVAVMTCIKSGVGVAGIEFGTGLVVSRLANDNYWSPPCAIGTAGLSWGALVGLQLSDHVFLLMTDKAVDMFVNNEKGSFQLGADVGVAVGPLGRSVEADIGAIDGDLTPIYTYSLSKGFYAGISLDGKVIVTRHHVNEKFYGRKIDPKTLLSGDVPTPPAAQPLYDALKRCHVYASTSSSRAGFGNRRQPGYLSTQNNIYSYGDGNLSLSSYEIEDDYNISSRHYAPY